MISPPGDPAPFIMHPCVEPGCRRLALGARCHEHMSAEDRAALDELHVAVIAAADAEERWREARRRVGEAERAAGVRRGAPMREDGLSKQAAGRR